MVFYFCLFFSIQIIFAQFDWELDGAPIRQGIHIEWQRSGATVDMEYGEIVFSWSDTRDGNRNVYVQKIDSNGNKLWGDLGTAVVEFEGRQEDPLIVEDGEGGIFVVWVDYRDEPNYGDIYAQHINSLGQLSWDESGIALTNKTGAQVSPNMCIDGNNGAYVIWVDQSESFDGHVYATHLTSNASEIVAQGTGVPIVSNESSHSGISLEIAGSGDAVLVWTDNRNGGDNTDIFGQRIRYTDGSIETLWGTPEDGGLGIAVAENNQSSTKVTYMSESKTIIVWQDTRDNQNDANIYFQILDESGTNLVDLNGKELCTSTNNQILPRVKSTDERAFVIWTDYRNGFKTDLYAQSISLTGEILWDENGLPITNAEDDQEQARLTVNNSGAYIVWEDERNGNYPEIDIYLQYLDNDGNRYYGSDLAVSTSTDYQFSPLVRQTDLGVFVLWGDKRDGSIGIYSQVINSSQNITLEAEGALLYYGIDGFGINPGIVNVDGAQSLIFWEDKRSGSFGSYAYGFKIDREYYSDNNVNGELLCNDPNLSSPTAVNIDNNIFMGYDNNSLGDIVQYYTLIDESLNLSSYQAINQDAVLQENAKIILGEDGYVYYVFNDFPDYIDADILVQKFDSNGNSLWDNPITVVSDIDTYTDEIIVEVLPMPGEGCFISFDYRAGSTKRVYAVAIDGAGNYASGWNGPKLLCDVSSKQYSESLSRTNEGYVVSWRDYRNSNNDIYAQHIGFSGDLLGPSDGIPVIVSDNEQKSSITMYSSVNNSILSCWQDYENGSDFDINCVATDLNDFTNGSLINLVSADGDQVDPQGVVSSSGQYIITWSDLRNASSGFDIYYQILDESFMNEVALGGESVSSASYDQTNPQISRYASSSNEESFIIFWSDMRSSGKEALFNIYAQSLSINACENNADINFDGITNILDVVQIVNYVLGNSTFSDSQICNANVNGDDVVNILDIITIVNAILG